LLLVASCFRCSPPFFFRSYTPHFYHPPYLFRFDKFSSFLHGTFGAPHLVIKKKGRKETTKERVKARCRITKKAKEGKQKKAIRNWRASIFGAPKLSNSAPKLSYLVHHLFQPGIWCPLSTFTLLPSTPPLPFSVQFHLVPTAFSTCLHPYSTLHLLIDCANPCSKVKPSYSSTNTYSVQVVSSDNRSIQASLVAALVASHPCWRGKNE
jgi:hypothetical protein